jgi:hypothetical protein
MPAQNSATYAGVGTLSEVNHEAGRREPYLQLPIELLTDPDIDPFALAAWAALKSWCDFGSEQGAHPSDTKAAERAGMSRRVFIDRRNLLREKGWIEWQNTGKTNTYIVHTSVHANPTDSDEQSAADVQEVHKRSAGDAQRDVQEMHIRSAGDAHHGVQEMHTTYI